MSFYLICILQIWGGGREHGLTVFESMLSKLSLRTYYVHEFCNKHYGGCKSVKVIVPTLKMFPLQLRRSHIPMKQDMNGGYNNNHKSSGKGVIMEGRGGEGRNLGRLPGGDGT